MSTASYNRLARVLFALITLFCLITATPSFSPSAATAATTFRNPLSGTGPDPWMTCYNGNYYLAAVQQWSWLNNNCQQWQLQAAP